MLPLAVNNSVLFPLHKDKTVFKENDSLILKCRIEDFIKQKMEELKEIKSNPESIRNKKFQFLFLRDLIWSTIPFYQSILFGINPKRLKIQKATSGMSQTFILESELHSKTAKGVFKSIEGAVSNRGRMIPDDQTAIRERLAFALCQYLDKASTEYALGIKSFGVPPTCLTLFQECDENIKNKEGSYQKFCKGRPLQDVDDSQLPFSEILKMFLIDIISLNTDRHLGNVLVSDKNELILIDHGSILPDLSVCKKSDLRAFLELEWMYHPLARQSIPPVWKKFILSLSPTDIVTTFVGEMENHKKNFDPKSMQISGNALFCSFLSLHFLQHCVKQVDLPLIEIIRLYKADKLDCLIIQNEQKGQVGEKFDIKEIFPSMSFEDKEKFLNDLRIRPENSGKEFEAKIIESEPVFGSFAQKNWADVRTCSNISVEQAQVQKKQPKTKSEKQSELSANDVKNNADQLGNLIKNNLMSLRFKMSIDQVKEKLESSK